MDIMEMVAALTRGESIEIHGYLMKPRGVLKDLDTRFDVFRTNGEVEILNATIDQIIMLLESGLGDK